MTKVKQDLKAVNHSPVAHLKAVKNNPIQKKKGKQFANTPVGKIRLVNGKKVQNNNSIENKSSNKQKEEKEVIKDSPDSPDSNSSSPKGNKEKNSLKRVFNLTKTSDSPDSPDSPDSNSGSPKSNNKKNSPKRVFNLTKTSSSSNAQSGKNKKTPTKNVDEEDESDESTEDINEGIILPEDSIVSQDDNDDDDDENTDEDESDTELPNILGQSLADDTDEDDSDFEEEEIDADEDEADYDSDEGGASQLKGVKMFKGLLKQKFDSIEKNDHDDDDNDNNDDSEDDDNMDGSDLETDTSVSPGENQKKKGNISVIENEEDDDEGSEEDEDDEDDDDDDDEESALGLKDLLGNSIVDDDESDEDFEGEDEDDEDIDISDEELEADAEELDEDKRTIFIGNIPKDTKKEEIRKLFREFGVINSIRIRNVAPVNIKTSKKVAAIKNQIHKNIDHICMLIVFRDEESVSKALSMNGKQFKGHYLRVDGVDKNKTKPDAKKAVFLGNLSFKISDNEVWNHFEQCGEIESVRLIRDKKSRMGKGIGYVNFKNEDSVPLALELDGSTLLNREVRVKRCLDEKVVSKSEKKSTNNRNKRSAESKVKKSPKKLKVNDEAKTTSPVMNVKKKLKAKGKSEENSSPNSGNKKTVFQGQKAIVGKKAKKSKLDKKKKKIAAILTAKPKKVQKL